MSTTIENKQVTIRLASNVQPHPCDPMIVASSREVAEPNCDLSDEIAAAIDAGLTRGECEVNGQWYAWHVVQ
jgi:hypothetical protein